MEYNDFSHKHNLTNHQVTEGQTIHCSRCERLCHNKVYACLQCNYFLHHYCANAVRYIKKHPSDPQHPLVLIPKPTYCSGSFICNACGQTGTSFSYCCVLCEIDLHIHCAFLPLEVSHKLHQHELKLYIGDPNKKDEVSDEFCCKICSQPLSTKHFCYLCLKCEFGAHTSCATNSVKPELYLDDASSAKPGTTSPEAVVANGLTAEDVIAETYNLQLQMQMAQGLAQLMASFNPSLN
ncbi:putative nucleoredoxin 1-1 [Heracleum sosnowskyi]|uniref:Nucleoredoxin 1-1 n=1 Tax=Heracleum sosnowskyi TaxID=360622 RepID=A0AAD8N5N3_9APIA|nr:putative nucleoredoxin 1-1 [Heracleum sosnowskyi]